MTLNYQYLNPCLKKSLSFDESQINYLYKYHFLTNIP